MVGLLDCPSLHTLDIQDNQLDDPELLDHVFSKMENLTVLFTKGNEFFRHIPNYRKRMINRCVNLDYLNDRPVFPDERRLAEAFCIGDKAAEKEERKQIRSEEAEKR